MIAAAGSLLWLVAAILIAARTRSAGSAGPPPERWPSITIVVAALNEERTIEAAMRSLLRLDYPALSIVAVDDRSTDVTGAILDRLATEHPERLRVLHVTELPAGWLGKCHALARGSELVDSEWMLFTDADVLFEPEALRVAATFVETFGVDHFVFFPRMLWHDYAEAALLALFMTSLGAAFQTFRVESRSLDAYIGIGAFNMIRRDLYLRFGGHEPLRLEVADDMKLGYLAKKYGGRSMTVDSEGLVSVRWREGALDIVRGMERSGFAGVNFSWTRIMLAPLYFVGVLMAPYVLPFFAPTPLVIGLAAASIIAIVAAYALSARASRLPLWIGILHPVAALLMTVALLRSAIVTSIRGGLSWRGNFYRIDELKRGSVR
jgi:glycosyltransferase involved in cell wall biosynthesis